MKSTLAKLAGFFMDAYSISRRVIAEPAGDASLGVSRPPHSPPGGE